MTPPSSTECPICLGDVLSPSKAGVDLDCGHRFHKKCINAWFKRSVCCPCCRCHSRKAIERPSGSLLATAFSRLLARLHFPQEATDIQRVHAVLDTQVIMDEWNVGWSDRVFLKELAAMSPTVDDFLVFLRRLKM